MNHNELASRFLENKKLQREEYQNHSKERLKRAVSKRMTTAMIAALDSFERRFGFLWKDGGYEIDYYALYQEARKEILDKGNSQIRDVETELNNYNIEAKRFEIRLPVRNRE